VCASAIRPRSQSKLRWGRWGLIGLLPALAFAAEPWPDPPVDSLPTMAQVSTASNIRIHALRTGWVGVKGTHRELDVPPWMALPSIVLGRSWAEWMPITVFVVEHPEGVFVIDTGPSPRINEPDYFACDKGNEFFYKRNMRFFVPTGDTLGPRLAQAGIDAKRVKGLVITHFHADHVGGVDLLPQAKVYTGTGNWPQHVGAFTCRLPAGFQPSLVRFDNPDFSTEKQGHALTSDGKVQIVPLPGHTPGHVGVSVTDGGRTWLIAGDATFDQDQTDRGAVTGVSQNINQAIQTQGALRRASASSRLTLLPAHDPSVFKRLQLP
jgi:N-acyl homoserine lactone hydrolase